MASIRRLLSLFCRDRVNSARSLQRASLPPLKVVLSFFWAQSALSARGTGTRQFNQGRQPATRVLPSSRQLPVKCQGGEWIEPLFIPYLALPVHKFIDALQTWNGGAERQIIWPSGSPLLAEYPQQLGKSSLVRGFEECLDGTRTRCPADIRERSSIQDDLPRAARLLAYGGRRLAQHTSDDIERYVESVVQHEGQPLGGRQPIEHDGHGERNALPGHQ